MKVTDEETMGASKYRMMILARPRPLLPALFRLVEAPAPSRVVRIDLTVHRTCGAAGRGACAGGALAGDRGTRTGATGCSG